MMRIKLFFISLLFLAAGNLRAQDAYTVLSYKKLAEPIKFFDHYDNIEYTLTYYFDNNKDSWEGGNDHYVYPVSNNLGAQLGSYVLERLDSVTFDDSFANYRELTSLRGMFYRYRSLKAIKGIQNLNTSHVTDMSYMFYECYSLTDLDVSHFDTKNVTDMSYMFMRTKLSTLNVKNFDTRNVINMRCMFEDCHARDLDVSNFNTQNVTDMGHLFDLCGTKKLDVSNFDTHNVIKMDAMFRGAESIAGLKALDTSNVITMEYMFAYYKGDCLDLSSFDTSNVKYMYYMFAGFEGDSIDLSGFNISRVYNMSHMFYMAKNLRTLDLSSFDTSNVGVMTEMFYQAIHLEKIYVSDGWNMERSFESGYNKSMFYQCTSLIGGQGTKYDGKHIDGLYARIDGGESSPGYFTKKSPASIINSIVQKDAIDKYYKLDGVSVRQPAKGLNILRMSEGKVKKILVK